MLGSFVRIHLSDPCKRRLANPLNSRPPHHLILDRCSSRWVISRPLRALINPNPAESTTFDVGVAFELLR